LVKSKDFTRLWPSLGNAERRGEVFKIFQRSVDPEAGGLRINRYFCCMGN